MSKMWEYRANKLFIEHDRQALEDVLNSVEGAGKKWKPQDELGDEFLNRMGAEGWELLIQDMLKTPPEMDFGVRVVGFIRPSKEKSQVASPWKNGKSK